MSLAPGAIVARRGKQPRLIARTITRFVTSRAAATPKPDTYAKSKGSQALSADDEGSARLSLRGNFLSAWRPLCGNFRDRDVHVLFREGRHHET
jgi:hypothetical protein